jgi:thioredoxin-related protein
MPLNFYSQEIKWTSFSDLNDSLKAKPKKVIIKIEADWCGYCKMMDVNVFSHKRTQVKLGETYYFVKLNAESKEEIIFRNHLFKPSSFAKGKHELAITLNGKENTISYPTVVLLSPNLEIENRLNGYLKRNHFFQWLKSR